MQMGTRWTAGKPAPAAVPEEMKAAIADVEGVALTNTPGPDAAPSWTLTWLEGRPIAELDTGVIVEIEADGDVVVRHDPEYRFP